jgi:hypothetical protein
VSGARFALCKFDLQFCTAFATANGHNPYLENFASEHICKPPVSRIASRLTCEDLIDEASAPMETTLPGMEWDADIKLSLCVSKGVGNAFNRSCPN